MLEIVQNIGQVVRSMDATVDFVSLWQKKPRPFDYIIVVDLKCEIGKFTCETIEYRDSIFKETLFYQQSNLHMGAAVLIEDRVESKKLLKNINKSLAFLEVETITGESILERLFQITGEVPKETYFVAFYKDGQKPFDLYKEKFTERIFRETLNDTKQVGCCHLCGKTERLYHTGVYACYNNDKEVYKNTEGYNFALCKECIVDVLAGKRHSENILTTRWLGTQVMFLPHTYNKEICSIYESQDIEDGKRILQKIEESEWEVLDELGKQNTWCDIVFYSADKAFWKFEYVIKGIMPSRFTQLARLCIKYKNIYKENNLSLWQVIKTLSISQKGQETKRLLEVVFKGHKISRTFVFNRLMADYKTQRLKGYTSMNYYHRVYNFLCEAGCLKNNWQLVNEEGELVTYESVEQFFEVNQKYFDTEVKRAWFLLGKAFGKAIYHSKNYYKESSESKDNGKSESYLEKGFFYSRKFDQKTFMILANKCSDALYKYGVTDHFLKQDVTEAKALYGNAKETISTEEAKYIFFWGMDQMINYKGE